MTGGMSKDLQEYCERHAHSILALMQSHALETMNANVTLFFDVDGQLRKIEMNAVVYKR